MEQPALRQMLPPLQNLHILDLGCGFGDLALHCAEQGAAKVTGVDLSEKMLEQAKRHPCIHYVQGAMEDIRFKPSQFDLVVSSLAVHYVENFDDLISRITDWLKPGGYFVFSTEHPITSAHQKRVPAFILTMAQKRSVHDVF